MTTTNSLEEPRFSSNEMDDVIQKMDDMARLVEIQEKTAIVNAGEIDSSIYMVAEGEVIVEVPIKGRWLAVAWLTPGSIIGELSFFDSRPRAARVIARTTCKLYCVSRESFDRFATEFPADAMRFVWRLSEIMAYRLRRIEQFDSIEYGREDERKGLAADLHDQTMNDLSAILMFLGLLKSTASDTSSEILDEIDTISEMVKGADKKLRTIVKGMAQDSVVRLGVVKSLDDHFQELSAVNQPNSTLSKIQFSCEGLDSGKLPEAVGIDLYNIIHQAVANCLAHSKAQVITVSLSWGSEILDFSIQDDGVGFDPSRVRNNVESEHFGLLNLKLRAERMSGTLSLDSTPGNGTLIKGSIPIRNDSPSLSSKRVTDYEFSS